MTPPYYETELGKLYCGDCLEVLKGLPGNSIDSMVTDPPYGISFMGKKWDYQIPSVEVWQECLRVLKPGAHALVACGTRTQHRMAVNIEDAGFELRDIIGWLYGSGFPKSLNIGKAVDKLPGNERETVGENPANRPYCYEKGETSTGWKSPPRPNITKVNSKWEGYGTALKPACEYWTLARKPLSEKTIAANVLKWGTGGLNIDGCRIGTDEKCGRPQGTMPHPMDWGNKSEPNGVYETNGHDQGRFPANLIHDGSEQVVRLFPDTGKSAGGRTIKRSGGGNVGGGKLSEKEWSNNDPGFGDSGSAARFFYCAKSSRSERGEGNSHPTVKPLKLMKYLVKLITPGGVCLDPFMGSGTTGIACRELGIEFIGIELKENYMAIAAHRIEQESRQLKLFGSPK